jgi:hypothetical protein
MGVKMKKAHKSKTVYEDEDGELDKEVTRECLKQARKGWRIHTIGQRFLCGDVWAVDILFERESPMFGGFERKG